MTAVLVALSVVSTAGALVAWAVAAVVALRSIAVEEALERFRVSAEAQQSAWTIQRRTAEAFDQMLQVARDSRQRPS